jgi:hypothetical protein
MGVGGGAGPETGGDAPPEAASAERGSNGFNRTRSDPLDSTTEPGWIDRTLQAPTLSPTRTRLNCPEPSAK